MLAMDITTLVITALTAVVGLAGGFALGRRQEHASARQERVRLYPAIATAMNDLVVAVEAVAPMATPGMDEATRTRLRAATQPRRDEFRRLWQGHAAVLPGEVVVALWAMDDAYRQLVDPSSHERIALAGLVVLTAARDAALRAVRADTQPDKR